MSELSTRMALIASTLAGMYPARVVTRSDRDPSQRDKADLLKGVYAIVSKGEGSYTNVPNYSAQDGRQTVLIVADIQLAETVEPYEIEDAEFALVDEIKYFVRHLPDTLCTMNLESWVQSGQVAHPYGWVVFQLEYVP